VTTFDIGDVVRLDAYTYDDDGTPTAPTTISVTIEKPDATEVTPSVTTLADGHYRVDYPTAGLAAGVYQVRWVATGDVAEVEPGAFTLKVANL
jgi:hypothetical protein